MRPSHGETTSKQEAHKLKVFVIGLFKPSITLTNFFIIELLFTLSPSIHKFVKNRKFERNKII